MKQEPQQRAEYEQSATQGKELPAEPKKPVNTGASTHFKEPDKGNDRGSPQRTR